MPRKTKEAQRQYWLANRERIKTNRRARYAANPAPILEYNRRYRAENAARMNAKRRERVYGTDGADLWEAQDGKCGICAKPMVAGHRNPDAGHIDHDHDTGAVRGWLCSRCNVALGNFNDSPAFLRAALAYLESHGVKE